MYNFSNLDLASECIKTIVNNVRCVLCDRREGLRLRYSCGHVTCSDCGSRECTLCIEPGQVRAPVLDEPLSRRVQNISELLTTYQDVFKVDALRNKRLSEQLKIEKELFPQCIQAPIKYFNRRRSLNIPQKKRNRKSTVFPGEAISLLNIEMDRSKSYVEQWLRQQVTGNVTELRQPLTNLNVNAPGLKNKGKVTLKNQRNSLLKKAKENFKTDTKISRKKNFDSFNLIENQHVGAAFKSTKEVNADQNHEKLKSEFDVVSSFNYEPNKDIEIISVGDSQNIKLSRKRTYPSINSVENHCPDTDLKTAEDVNVIDYNSKKLKSTLVCESSLIDLPNTNNNSNKNTEIITVDDSQNEITDKDKLALIAVQEADNAENGLDTHMNLQCFEIMKYTDVESTLSIKQPVVNELANRVPFFKKGTILENCRLCSDFMKTNNNKNESNNDVAIAIESKDFIITVNLSNYVQKKLRSSEMCSIPIQTDVSDLNYIQSHEITKHTNDLLFKTKSKVDALLLERNNIYDISKQSQNKSFLSNQSLIIEKGENSCDNVMPIIKNMKNQKLTVIEESDSEIEKEEILPNKLTVIEESDSDVEREERTPNKLTVIKESDSDIEKQDKTPNQPPCTFGVLAELDKKEYNYRARNITRRRTPASTDSSDKENRDPNRKKFPKLRKKNNKKK